MFLCTLLGAKSRSPPHQVLHQEVQDPLKVWGDRIINYKYITLLIKREILKK